MLKYSYLLLIHIIIMVNIEKCNVQITYQHIHYVDLTSYEVKTKMVYKSLPILPNFQKICTFSFIKKTKTFIQAPAILCITELWNTYISAL